MKLRTETVPSTYDKHVYQCDLCKKEIEFGRHTECTICGADMHSGESTHSSYGPEGKFDGDNSYSYCPACLKDLERYWKQLEELKKAAKARRERGFTPEECK